MLEPGLPGLGLVQVLPRSLVDGIKKPDPVRTGLARLRQQRLPQWVVTPDEELVSCVQSLQKPALWNAAGLAVDAAVAIAAGENQVPYAVYWEPQLELLKSVRQEVVHVSAAHVDVTEAVEAFALLVAIERIATTRQAGPAAT